MTEKKMLTVATSLPVDLAIIHAPEDGRLLDELMKHLSMLRRQGLVSIWHPGLDLAGCELSQSCAEHLNQSEMIFLLVSPDFIASDECMRHAQHAFVRHHAGKTSVATVLIRPTDWQDTFLGGLPALPPNGQPVSRWKERDDAWANVTGSLRLLLGFTRRRPKA